MQLPKQQNLASLTSMRFIAAFFVAIHHTRVAWAHTHLVDIIGQVGWLSVSYFFVLSGFVLMWSFKPDSPMSVFIWKRIARIYPLHFITLIVSLTSFALFSQPLAGYVGTVPGTVANFLLLHDWLPGHPEVRQAWNGVSWTLSCEFMFYLLAPFIFPLMMRAAGAGKVFLSICAIWACMLLIAFYAVHKQEAAVLDFLVYHPLPRLVEFLLGASGAMLMRKGWAFRSVPVSLALMSIPVAIYCYMVPESAGRQGAIMNLMFIPGAFLLIMSLGKNELEGAATWLQNKWVIILGEASYAFYMTHALFLGAFALLRHKICPTSDWSPLWGEGATVAYLVTAVTISLLVHYFFEIPTKNFLLRLTNNSKPAIADAPVVEIAN